MLFLSSRSDSLMVAVEFNPRIVNPSHIAVRRVATL
jgi:hypothetical protein